MSEYTIDDLRHSLGGAPAARAGGQPPTGLVAYRARGRVLLVGEAGRVAAASAALPEGLQPSAVVVGDGAASGARIRPLYRARRAELTLSGHLGDFSLQLGAAGGAQSPLAADLVVDLLDPPLLGRRLLPDGYFQAAADADLDALLAGLPEWIGTFEKPQYAHYVADLCARGRRGQSGCRRCLDACPAEAISDLIERVEIDPWLCQGGGACATACPSGAIRYAYPPPAETLGALRERLLAGRDGAPQLLLLHDREAGAARLENIELPAGWQRLALEELAGAGLDLWLSALAWGAAAVLLVRGGDEPVQSLAVLDEQMAVANAALAGLGYPPAVAFWGGDCDADNAAMPAIPAAEYAPQGAKRADAFAALDHLWRHAPQATALSPLPDFAPFGRIEIDAGACTLCQSCVAVCPSGALTPGDGLPQLGFFEDRCLQCGLCRGACPEDAIRLEARLLNDPAARRRRRVLHEEPPFCCRSCGKPFATRSVIERMRDKLAGHAMFSAEGALARLEMCEDCRVADMMRSGDL